MADLAVQPGDIAQAVLSRRTAGNPMEKGEPGMSTEARSAIDLAMQFAIDQGRPAVDGACLLVGLALSEGSTSQLALRDLGITADRIRSLAE